MHTYRSNNYDSNPKKYSVGYWYIRGGQDRWENEWQEVKRVDTEDDAIKFVNLLNGGPR